MGPNKLQYPVLFYLFLLLLISSFSGHSPLLCGLSGLLQSFQINVKMCILPKIPATRRQFNMGEIRRMGSTERCKSLGPYTWHAMPKPYFVPQSCKYIIQQNVNLIKLWIWNFRWLPCLVSGAEWERANRGGAIRNTEWQHKLDALRLNKFIYISHTGATHSVPQHFVWQLWARKHWATERWKQKAEYWKLKTSSITIQNVAQSRI